VRDENSRQLLHGSIGSEPPLVLDPCLQFPPQVEASEGEQPPFAAVYGHTFPRGFAAAARDWANRRGLRLVSVGYRNDWADEQRLDAGPLEFAGLIARASSVVTNFFHGCVFALLNDKPFACATSPYRLNKVRDLTQSLGAQHHLLRDGHGIDAVLDTPLSETIQRRLDHLREASSDYLQSVLA
jgi:hypothetical protein